MFSLYILDLYFHCYNVNQTYIPFWKLFDSIDDN